MFNFYPWGLSINVVKPKSPEYTEIEYLGTSVGSGALTFRNAPFLPFLLFEDNENTLGLAYKGSSFAIFQEKIE